MERRAHNHLDIELAVACGDETQSTKDKAAALSAELGIPLATELEPSEDVPPFRLIVSAKGVELCEYGRRGAGSVYVDFVDGPTGHRLRSTRFGKQPLATAMGLSSSPMHVVDATAGLGRDAFLLASLGCEVTAIERCPILGALLQDGLDRAKRGPQAVRAAGQRISLLIGDARSLLSSLTADATSDVVYLDPMYPPRNKRALPKKELRICRALVGDDRDAGELFLIARRVARKRVVVKRPRHAPLLSPRPHLQIRTKMVRYDVYRP
jgi:16S rRNA (guanine1516-N2)-methyltransferase